MAKLCPRGKAAAKRKFKVYPSAYANMYASAVCSGKVTPGGKKKSRTKKSTGGPAGEKRDIRKVEHMIGKNKNKFVDKRKKAMGGGMMNQPRAMYGKGGGVCIRGMNKDAVGKNS
tara:strand:+ start:461 stop:805 length:345 start_codon:yes stop_codon:yes gene_type:complete